jgi:hypothetical protein
MCIRWRRATVHESANPHWSRVHAVDDRTGVRPSIAAMQASLLLLLLLLLLCAPVRHAL